MESTLNKIFSLSLDRFYLLTSKKVPPQQRRDIAMVLAGTVLEYFDLMLYVHMGMSLAEHFLPVTEPLYQKILSSFSFIIPFLLRPLGGLFFGLIGDIKGRRPALYLATLVMSCSSLVIFLLPTYQSWGTLSVVLFLLCIMSQSFSCTGEAIGARIYIAEVIEGDKANCFDSLIGISSAIGGFMALGCISLCSCLSNDLLCRNEPWRMPFLIGALLAVLSFWVRRHLHETSAFIEMAEKTLNRNSLSSFSYKQEENIRKKNMLAVMGMEMLFPIILVVIYSYIGNQLKSNLGFNTTQVVHHNFFISASELIGSLGAVTLVWFFAAPKIVEVRTILTLFYCLAITPFLIYFEVSERLLFTLQIPVVVLCGGTTPAEAYFVRGFPIRWRYFRYALCFTMGKVLAYAFATFVATFLLEKTGLAGASLLLSLFCGVFLFSFYRFRNNSFSNRRPSKT
jgi:MFS family permease